MKIIDDRLTSFFEKVQQAINNGYSVNQIGIGKASYVATLSPVLPKEKIQRPVWKRYPHLVPKDIALSPSGGKDASGTQNFSEKSFRIHWTNSVRKGLCYGVPTKTAAATTAPTATSAAAPTASAAIAAATVRTATSAATAIAAAPTTSAAVTPADSATAATSSPHRQ